MWRAPRALGVASPPNKPMHPTADTNDVIFLHGAARRVISGVRRLRNSDMAKLERGRLDGIGGMATFTSAELLAWADRLESQIQDPRNQDDPRWLRRWAAKMRLLASKKEEARAHKERQR